MGRDLTRSRLRPSLYLLDEPATGLHIKETALLGELFMRLVDESHTMVTMDHSGLLGRLADAVLTLGDGSGSRGGRVKGTRGPVAT